jgi:hypothetical protein
MSNLRFRVPAAMTLIALMTSALAGCGGGGRSSSLPSAASTAQLSAMTMARTADMSTSAVQTLASSSSAYAAAVLSNAPLAYYQLNDSGATLVDSGPHSITGSYGRSVAHGAAPLTQGSNSAASFPGGAAYNPNGFAQTAVNSFLQPSHITLEAWFKFTTANAANTYVPIIAYGKQGTSYGMYLQGLGNNTAGLFYQQSNVGSAGRLLLHGMTRLSAGTTYHAVVVFNGTTITIYVNGLQDTSATFPGSVNYPKATLPGLQIGGQALSDAPFPGTVADVAVYGTPLSQQTVVSHFLAGQLLPMASEAAVPADTFVDSIGVNTHFENASMPYMAHFSAVKSMLSAAGIRHFRNNVSYSPTFIANVRQLAAVGIHGTYVLSPSNTMSQVQGYPAVVSPSLEQFEAPNEPDDQGGHPNWQQPCINLQKTLHSWIKNNPATARYRLLGPGLAYASDYKELGDLSAYMDVGNFHDYMGGYNPGFAGGPFGGMKMMLASARIVSGSKPAISTETGYSTILGNPSIDYRTDLRYMTRLFFEQLKAGISRSYVYEFVDESIAVKAFGTNGLVQNNLTPKPAYTGVKSLVAAIQDPGPQFTASPLSFNLSGLSTVHHLLMQKRNGTYILAIWLEVPSWNVASNSDINVANQSVTLTTAKAFSNASVSTMDENGNMSTSTLPWAGHATIAVSDKVSLVTLKP